MEMGTGVEEERDEKVIGWVSFELFLRSLGQLARTQSGVVTTLLATDIWSVISTQAIDKAVIAMAEARRHQIVSSKKRINRK